jgi:hypothetical protein
MLPFWNVFESMMSSAGSQHYCDFVHHFTFTLTMLAKLNPPEWVFHLRCGFLPPKPFLTFRNHHTPVSCMCYITLEVDSAS